MDPVSKKLFDDNKDDILNKATALFGITPENLKRLGAFESIVYEFERDGRSAILKLTHSLHRSVDAVRGELEWVDHLVANGVSCSPVVLSSRGQTVEKIDVEDSYFIVYGFEKAQGRLSGKDDWTEPMIRTWGRTLGRMHAATMSYEPSDPTIRRHDWREEVSMYVNRHLPSEQTAVIERCRELQKRLSELTTDGDTYGLVHSDLHHGNFFIADGRMTVFDFDDCHYDWFAHDLAMPLFYVMRSAEMEHDNAFAEFFLTNFLTGYREEHHLDSRAGETLPLFLKVREMELYIILHAEDAFEENDWCRRFAEGRRQRIEDDLPVLDLDFSRLL
ncbi:MAG: phosphotransferase [candidate division Zixibacteria bacterium]|nr:phosphotransferase [candidate division Zixibacteria bacterium]MDH3937657.1 phosphotransferase [candidate division Zixibacteria bacterium]MDH4034215.1 phosphotransferase [candidate division Zixibacteria bacterium]